ncbi:MAG: hypothetical protein HN644_05965 [Rhodospirillales bacterium]|nr:hypothetical protein [Rhodospirillales bacterium]
MEFCIIMYRSPDGFIVPDLPDNPSPEDRATYVILRLEQFIRDGRSLDEGMSFKKWQAMALTEIATNIADAQNEMIREDPVTNRLLFTAAASLITIGFWGTAVSFHHVGHLVAGIICAGAGAVLLFVIGHWRLRKWNNRRNAKERAKRLKRVENLNKRIKRLEMELVKEEEAIEEALRKRRLLMSR